MKLIPITAARLFKGTILLLGIPALLLPVIASLLILARLSGLWPPAGIGIFTFALTQSELATLAGIVLLAFIFCVFGMAVAIRSRRRKSRITR